MVACRVQGRISLKAVFWVGIWSWSRRCALEVFCLLTLTDFSTFTSDSHKLAFLVVLFYFVAWFG